MKLKNLKNKQSVAMFEEFKKSELNAVENNVFVDAVEQSKISKEEADKVCDNKKVKPVESTTACDKKHYGDDFKMVESVKDRAELKAFLEKLAKNKIKASIRRSVKEGYRYDVRFEKALPLTEAKDEKENDKKEFDLKSTLSTIRDLKGIVCDDEEVAKYVEEMVNGGYDEGDINSIVDCVSELVVCNKESDEVKEEPRKSLNVSDDGELKNFEPDAIDTDSDLPLEFNDAEVGVEHTEDSVDEDCGKKKLDEVLLRLDVRGSLEDHYKPWSGAVDLWNEIVRYNKVEELEFMLEDIYPDGLTPTELNDLLWFEPDFVREQLGLVRGGEDD